MVHGGLGPGGLDSDWIPLWKGLLLKGTPRIPNHQPKPPVYHYIVDTRNTEKKKNTQATHDYRKSTAKKMSKIGLLKMFGKGKRYSLKSWFEGDLP